jgi:hypothetical protein
VKFNTRHPQQKTHRLPNVHGTKQQEKQHKHKHKDKHGSKPQKVAKVQNARLRTLK